MGTGGRERTTVQGKNSAMLHFEKFLEIKGIKFDKTKIDAETERLLCDPTLFQEFASYLKDFALKSDENLLARGTAKQYIGGVKETIRALYPNNAVWDKHDDNHGKNNINNGWYTKIVKDLVNKITLRCIRMGISVEKRVFVIGRNGVAEINLYFFKQNTCTGVIKANGVNCTFHTVGRASEGGFVTYAQASMNIIEGLLYTDWNEGKVCEQNPMSFYPERNIKCWMLDFYFLLACYCIIGGASSYTQTHEFVNEMTERGNKDNSLIYPHLAINPCEKVCL